MAYESPIKIDREYSITNDAEEICRKIMKDEEAYIMYRVNLVVDVDKDELLKALQYDRDQYEKGYADGRMARDADIVRCKECEFYDADERWCRRLGLCGAFDGNDFCSHGEMKENDSVK